jgi:hypothetical protein
MASVAIASFARRCGLMDSATVLFPTVEYHVAVPSGNPILEVNIPSGFGRGHAAAASTSARTCPESSSRSNSRNRSLEAKTSGWENFGKIEAPAAHRGLSRLQPIGIDGGLDGT